MRSWSETRVKIRSERRSSLARPSGRRGGPESEASVVPPWPGLPVGEAGRIWKRARFLLGRAFWSETGSPFWPIVKYFGPAQELRIVRDVVYWTELLLGSRSTRDPGFMNPTLGL